MTANGTTVVSVFLFLVATIFGLGEMSMLVEILSLIAGTMAIGCFLALVAEESCA
jgi:uncharacterized membrane protein YuzA (DUF378 family)